MLSKCVYGGGSWRCFTSTWYGASDVSLPVYFPALNVSASSLPIISALSALSGGLGSHDWDEVNVPLWPLWGAVTLLKLPARTEGGGRGREGVWTVESTKVHCTWHLPNLSSSVSAIPLARSPQSLLFCPCIFLCVYLLHIQAQQPNEVRCSLGIQVAAYSSCIPLSTHWGVLPI